MQRHSVANIPARKITKTDHHSINSTPDSKTVKYRKVWSKYHIECICPHSPSYVTRSHSVFRLFLNAILAAVCIGLLIGCSTQTVEDRHNLQHLIRKTLVDPKLDHIFTDSYYDSNKNRTGSFQNCSSSKSNWIRRNAAAMFSSKNQLELSADILSNVVYVSCHPVHYRIPLDALERAAQAQTDIIIGILSNGGGDGPMRRQTIRHTWASIEGTSSSSSSPTKDSIIQNIQNTTRTVSTVSNDKSPSPQLILSRPGIFFLVAGPWDSKLSKEFLTHRDLIWIDEREVYDAETSVLTYKTQSFASIIHKEMKRFPGYQYTYLFKTDDDSYVNIDYLHYELIERVRMNPIFPLLDPLMWGICTHSRRKPNRDPKNKWSISSNLYPEEFYPRYCEGAGFALSRTLVQCAVDDGHIAEMRFMPFEDVSMGMVAERCRVENFVNAHELIHLYRTGYPYGTEEEYTRVDLNLGRLPDGHWLPEANMTNCIVQHRINSDADMIEHHLKAGDSMAFYYIDENE